MCVCVNSLSLAALQLLLLARSLLHPLLETHLLFLQCVQLSLACLDRLFKFLDTRKELWYIYSKPSTLYRPSHMHVKVQGEKWLAREGIAYCCEHGVVILYPFFLIELTLLYVKAVL